MKPVFAFAAAFALALTASLALAAPRPLARVDVPGRVTPATYTAGTGATVLLQCPGGLVWYRGLTSAEAAAGGLVTAGAGMTDGGAFGVLVDFTSMGDPMPVKLATNENTIALLGTDAGLVNYSTDGGTANDAGVLPCFLSVP